jgi:mRNA-degrading endonuclease toxin of MazEF toxin-antitoxin module
VSPTTIVPPLCHIGMARVTISTTVDEQLLATARRTRSELVERLGRLSDDRMRQICEALEIAVACEG